LKFAASGFSGLYPTISGISLGGFLRSIFVIELRAAGQWPNESHGSRRPRGPHAQDPPIEQERYGGEGHTADDDPGGFIAGPD